MEKITIEAGQELSLNVTMDRNTNIEGTSLQGYLPEGTTLADLQKVFGYTQSNGTADGKIRKLWAGRISGMTFTIYDYKTNKPIDKVTDWHIGAKSKLAAELVVLYFNAKNK